MTTPQPPQYNEFPIGAVLTIAVGAADHLFCTYGESLRILGYMHGQVPAPDQTQAFIDGARSAVLEQHPELADITPPPADAPDSEVLVWLGEQEATHGAKLGLTPLDGKGLV